MNFGLNGPRAASFVDDGGATGGPVNRRCDRKNLCAELSFAKG